MSTSSLYGNPAGTTVVPANDTTSLYGASSNAQVPNANGDLLIPGNLAVDGGNITTTSDIATVFNTNATIVSAFGAATSLSLGATTGSTSINNNLITGGTILAGGNITAPGGSFGNITIGVATDNTITTTTGNLNLRSATSVLTVGPSTEIEWAENSTRDNRLSFKSTNGTSTGIRVAPPVATGGEGIISVGTTNDSDNTQFISLDTRQGFTNPLRFVTGAWVAGVLGASGTSLAFIDGPSNLYATINPAGPTIGTDLTTKSYVDSIPNITYTIDASTTTGGANFNLRGSDASVDTIKFASGTGVTVSQTDANTITVTNAGVTSAVAGAGISVSSATGAVTIGNTGVRSITGTANQVIASASTGAVTLSLPQSIATTSTPTFAGATLGAIKVGVTTDNTIDTTSGNLVIAPATGIITVSAPTTIQYAENNTRTNRIQFQSSSGNSSGVRVLAPNATTSAQSTIGAFSSNDNNNGSFINLRAFGGGTDPLRIYTGTYTAGVLGASSGAAFVDNVTTYATVNPSGPTNSLDLITKAYFDSHPTSPGNRLVNGLYSLILNADGTVSFPNYKFPVADGSNNQVLKTNGSGVLAWYSPSDLNTTYNIDATATTGGANLNLNGSDSTTDPVAFIGSGGTTVTRTDANTITISTSTPADPSKLVNGSYEFTLNADGSVTTPNIINASGSSNLNLESTNGVLMLANAGGGNDAGFSVSSAGSPAFGGPWAELELDSTSFGSKIWRWSENGDTVFPSFTLTTGTGLAPGGGNGQSLLLDQITPGNYVAEWNYATTLSNGTAIPTTRYDLTINNDGTVSFPNYTFPAADGSADQVLKTDGSGVLSWYTPSDLNTTYTYTASSATGGANLTLTGSDATTNTVKLTNAGHITATYTSATEVTLGSDATTTATASVLVARDADANTFANATFNGFTSVAASGSLITLIAASTPNYLVTGSGGQVIQLPNATTLPNGAVFSFNNNQSSGAITVNNNSSTLVASIPSGGLVNVTLLSNAIAAGSWDIHTQAPSNVSWSTNTLTYPGSYSSSTGNVTANSTTIGSSVGTVSTSSGNLTLNTANGTGSSGSIVVTAGANGNISVTPNGTGLVVLGKTTLADMSRIDGQLYATKSTTWTPPSTGLTTIDGTNGLAVGSSGGGNGYSASVGITYYSGDTTAGANSSASLSIRGAGGTNASPSAIATNQVAGTWNIDGYATSGWASTIATTGSGGGTTAIAPLQVQGYAVSAFTDSAGTVTNAPMGFRVRGFAASTNLTAANRFNFMDLNATSDTFKTTTFNIQPTATATNYASFSATGSTIQNSATTNLIRTGSTGAQVPATILRYSRTDQTGPQDSDGVDFRLSVGGTSTTSNFGRVDGVYKSSGLNEIGISVSTDSFATNTNRIFIGTRESTKIQATPSGGGSVSTIVTATDLSVGMARAVAFASYTTTTRNALTPSAGWVIWNTTTVKLECYDGTTWQALF